MMTMLSKDEFITCMYYIDTASYTQAYKEKAIAHDQAQRAVIARLEAEHRDLVLRNKLLRDRPDLPLERIRAYDEVITKIEQQAKEITELREALQIGFNRNQEEGVS
jgi:cell division protein FtsB